MRQFYHHSTLNPKRADRVKHDDTARPLLMGVASARCAEAIQHRFGLRQ